MNDLPCEGRILCIYCDNQWVGSATAGSPLALADALDRVWEEHFDTHPDHRKAAHLFHATGVPVNDGSSDG